MFEFGQGVVEAGFLSVQQPVEFACVECGAAAFGQDVDEGGEGVEAFHVAVVDGGYFAARDAVGLGCGRGTDGLVEGDVVADVHGELLEFSFKRCPPQRVGGLQLPFQTAALISRRCCIRCSRPAIAKMAA
nr:MAG TPA: hypothetical protein [Caudoviricetes sp.]